MTYLYRFHSANGTSSVWKPGEPADSIKRLLSPDVARVTVWMNDDSYIEWKVER